MGFHTKILVSLKDALQTLLTNQSLTVISLCALKEEKSRKSAEAISQ